MMELIEDLESVIKYIYRSRNADEMNVSEILAELKKANFEKSDYNKLKNMLYSHSNNNDVINEEGFRSALQEFVDSTHDSSGIINNNNMTSISNSIYPSFIESSSFESITSEDYRIRVEDLQNEVEKKDHDIKKLQKDLKFSTQTIQSYEEMISTLSTEKEALRNSLQKVLLKVDDRNYEELADSRNDLFEKLVKQKETSGKLQKQNEKLKENIEKLDEEKNNLVVLRVKHKDEIEKLFSQLKSKELELQACKEETIKLSLEINYQQKAIDDLVTVKNELEKELKESLRVEIYRNSMTEYSSPENQSILSEEKIKFESILQDDLSIEDRERISFSGKFSFSTSTPYNKLSLMDELIQVNEGSSFDNNNKVIKTFNNQEIQTDCTSTDNSPEKVNDMQLEMIKNNLEVENKNKKLREKMLLFTKKNMSLNQKLYKLHKVIKQLKRENNANSFLSVNFATGCNETDTQSVETQTEFNDELTDLEVDQQNISFISHPVVYNFPPRSESMCSRFWTFIYGKTCRLLTIISFVMAILHLYNVFKYCHNIKNGSSVSIIPWKDINLEEFLMSIFNFEYVDNGPVPF